MNYDKLIIVLLMVIMNSMIIFCVYKLNMKSNVFFNVIVFILNVVGVLTIMC